LRAATSSSFPVLGQVGLDDRRVEGLDGVDHAVDGGRAGEQLDAGQAGLVVVGVSDMGAKIEHTMRR